jgi:hypothetical protein
MDHPNKPDLTRQILALLGGIAAIFVTGLILYPIVKVIFDNYFEIYFGDPPPGTSKKRLIISITTLLWLVISAMCGGLVTSLISPRKEYQCIWILMGILITIFLLIAAPNDFRQRDLPLAVLFTLLTTAGALWGGYFGIRYKKNKRLRS